MTAVLMSTRCLDTSYATFSETYTRHDIITRWINCNVLIAMSSSQCK